MKEIKKRVCIVKTDVVVTCIFRPYSLKLTFQVINAKMDFFALILGPLIKGGVNFGDLNYMEC